MNSLLTYNKAILILFLPVCQENKRIPLSDKWFGLMILCRRNKAEETEEKTQVKKKEIKGRKARK